MMLTKKMVIITQEKDLGDFCCQNKLSVQHGQINSKHLGHHREGY